MYNIIYIILPHINTGNILLDIEKNTTLTVTSQRTLHNPRHSPQCMNVYIPTNHNGVMARIRGAERETHVGNLVIPYYSIDYLYSILNLTCIMIGYIKVQ